jgi:hypothetical protein
LNIPYVETSAKHSTNVEQAFKATVTDGMPISLVMPPKASNIKEKSDMKPIESMAQENSLE